MQNSPFELALAQGHAVRREFERAAWKRRLALMSAGFAGALIAMLFRLAQYAEYIEAAGRV